MKFASAKIFVGKFIFSIENSKEDANSVKILNFRQNLMQNPLED